MKVRVGGLVLLFALLQITCSAAGAQGATVILADSADPYYALAEEIAQTEGLPIAQGLDQALDREPAFLLWIVSPSYLSDQAVIGFGLSMRGRPSAISTGIITGATLQEARALWQRAGQARGQRAVAVNAANPSGHIDAGITEAEDTDEAFYPLTKTNLIDSLQRADYLTFTGHGGSSYLRLDDETTQHLPPLGTRFHRAGFRPARGGSLCGLCL
jgi:hypothetical protein